MQVEQLFLVRHAETDWNAERRLQGHADKPLSLQGRAQAVALGKYLRNTQFDAIFCSDLKRTRETTELAGFVGARAERVWREFDVGHWSGRFIDDIVAREGDAYSRWRAGDRAPPDGESWHAFESRIRLGLAVLESVPGRVLLVTHSGVIRAITKIILRMPRGTLATARHASVSVLDFKPAPNMARYDFSPGDSRGGSSRLDS